MNTAHETTLDVTGMSCGSCVRHVSSLDGVTNVDVRLKEGKAMAQRHEEKKHVEHGAHAHHGPM